MYIPSENEAVTIKSDVKTSEDETLAALADLVVAGFKLGDLRLLATHKSMEKRRKT